MHWIWKVVLFFGVFYLALAAALYLLQRKMMFGPDRSYVSPAEVNLPGLQEVVLTSRGGHRLVSWYLPAKAGQPTVLFFHGNGGNVANREEKFRQLHARGLGVFMLGYRGFGGSEGAPSEAAFIADARLLYDHALKMGLAPDNIVIYGESIGTSVAVQLAADVSSLAVILEAPMYSVLSIAEARYPYFPVRTFLRDKFETNLFIKDVRQPLLVVHGTDDEIIPLASGRRLFEAANAPKRFFEVQGGGHNNLYDFPIVDEMVAFLQDEVTPIKSLVD